MTKRKSKSTEAVIEQPPLRHFPDLSGIPPTLGRLSDLGEPPVKPGPARCSVWSNTPKCELWEAICLTFDLEPIRRMRLPQEYGDRLKVALANAQQVRMQGDAAEEAGSQSKVLLADVAVAAISWSWNIPDQLRQLAAQLPSQLARNDLSVIAAGPAKTVVPLATDIAKPVLEVAACDEKPAPGEAEPPGKLEVSYRQRGKVMQKRALIAKYGNSWASMESCFKNAHANGLQKAAKAEVRGEWFEADAVAWAKKQGNMKDPKESANTSLENVWSART